MNTRILMSILTIVAVVGGASAVTFAFFSDSGTSTGNVFSSGTIDLKLTDANETDADTVTATIGGTNLAPGNSVSGTLNLKNSGTYPANHAELHVVDINSDATNHLDKVLEITQLKYNGLSILPLASDPNGNLYADLDDLATLGLDNLALTDLATNHAIDMTLTFRSDAGNEYQGDTVTSNWTIDLNQDSTQ